MDGSTPRREGRREGRRFIVLHAHAALRWLVVALGAALCAALPGAAAVGAAQGYVPSGGALPWEAAGPSPAYFDLRAEGRVTPVRRQDNFGTCWIHSAMGSLESCLLPGALLDLSENNLANHMGSRLDFEGRADASLSTAYFARWDGPVLERDDPYPRKGRSPEGLRPVRHVQEVLYLPDRTGPLDNDALKWAVRTYGGVDAAMAFENRYLNSDTFAYDSTKAGLVLDHRVTCVGWDDGFPASRFSEPPPGGGAFLIKNSWGTGWGDAGYFWISYYDANFGRDMVVFSGAEGADNYDAIYQYDALGWSRSLGYGSDSAWFANRFRCAGSGTVRAVSFYTPVPGSVYEVRVAGGVADLAGARPAGAGVIALAGYHTVRLETPVPVSSGSVFVVAVKLTTPGRHDPIPLEAPAELIAPRAARGQSYVSADGASWQDLTTRLGLSRANVCLKAFVDASSGGDVRAPKALVWSMRTKVGGTAQVGYSVSDPAFSCASAALTIAVRSADGAVQASTRVPALQVGEQGVWRFRCAVPAGSYTLVARAYDVAGNKQAGSSRAVLRVAAGAASSGRLARR